MKKTDHVIKAIWGRLWLLSKKENTRSCYDSHLRMLEKTFYPFETKISAKSFAKSGLEEHTTSYRAIHLRPVAADELSDEVRTHNGHRNVEGQHG